MEERLKELILNDKNEFIEIFLEWLDNYDDKDISCKTDVVNTLIKEIEEDISIADL